MGGRKPVYGHGINDVDLRVHADGKILTAYSKWQNMLQRCFDLKYLTHHRSYTGCTVCVEWLLFSNFHAWHKQLQKYRAYGGLDGSQLSLGCFEKLEDAVAAYSVAKNRVVRTAAIKAFHAGEINRVIMLALCRRQF